MEDDIENQHSSPPITVLALANPSEYSGAFLYIEYKDWNNKLVRELFPSKDIDKKNILGPWLADRGFICPRKKKDFDQIVNIFHTACSDVKERITLSPNPGYLDKSYLYPDGLVINSDEAYGPLLVPGANMHLPNVQSCGDLASWKDNVACYALHSTRFMLALCSVFSAPLLRFSGMESGGFQFFGESSTGKTSAMRFAASAYGDPSLLVS